jgi:hypothetical protein
MVIHGIHEELIGPCTSKKELTGPSQSMNNSVLLLLFLVISTQQRKEMEDKLQSDPVSHLPSKPIKPTGRSIILVSSEGNKDIPEQISYGVLHVPSTA